MFATDPVTRRTLFGMAAGGLLSTKLPSLPGTAAGVLPAFKHANDPVLHVAGPRDSTLAAWARRLQPALASGLMDGGRLALDYRGGPNGVIAANQFDARVLPDGQDALLFPGSVAVDYLAGMGPVRLDPAHMLPLLAAFGPGVLMVRGGLNRPVSGHGPLRLAVPPRQDSSLTALLGLDLLGIPAQRVSVGADPETALRTGYADAVFLTGPDAWAKGTTLIAAGCSPVLSTCSGLAGDTGPAGLQAPFFLSALPATRLREDALVQAWHAVAAASTLCAVLVLPRLSPAAAIGQWRRAAHLAAADDAVAALARRQALRLRVGADAGPALAPMRAPPAAQLALRRWMQRRQG